MKADGLGLKQTLLYVQETFAASEWEEATHG